MNLAVVVNLHISSGLCKRDLISQRTKEGLRVKKAAGVKLGRPKGPGKSKLDKHRVEIDALLKNGSTKTFIAKRYDTSVSNLHGWLKRHNFAVKISFVILLTALTC